jgi:Mn2+/Fe2+ NRAMP family transporter
MKRSILALIAGFVLWLVVASLLNRGLRVAFAGYGVAEPTMSFTLGMKLARLIVGALASLAAGAATAMMTQSRTRVAWVLGAILLAGFIPMHIQIWAKFPVWYHLTFLLTLIPLVLLGAALTRTRSHNVSVPSAL